MIEIIREEEISGTTERRDLPKNIKQMGNPDIGDRIYIENEVYQYLHPYSSMEERRAYVMLGKFENYAGRECVFIEAAISLDEVVFEADVPVWNDATWAYIYRQLRREYDSMVIVGWALDIKGQLPNMTARLEQLHQSHFGGMHQVLFLMDSLEREEAFYCNKNGHLHRRDGFYVYYDNVISTETPVGESQVWPADIDTPKAYDTTTNTQGTWRESREKVEETEFYQNDRRPERGNYRKQVAEQAEYRPASSYASTALLVVIVCALGITAYMNNEKMKAMEETLAKMNQTQIVAESSEQAEVPEVAVEEVAGDVPRVDDADYVAENAAETNAAEMAPPPVEVAAGESAENSDTLVETANSEALNGKTVDSETAETTAESQMTETSDSQEETGDVAENETQETMTEAQTYLSQGYYIVQQGDSLAGISRKIYQTTAMMDKLCEVNEIEDEDAIYAGQKLILPN